MIENPAVAPIFPRPLAALIGFPAGRGPRPPCGFFVIGATHRTAPLRMRERLALSTEAEAELARELACVDGLQEFVLLSTCNRLELYGVAAHPGAIGDAESRLCAHQAIVPAEFEEIRLRREAAGALRHILEVAVGLDSQMLGETEIFGQMKRAYTTAQARGSAGPVLNRVFQKVFQGAKHVRTRTAIGAGQVGVASVAVELALNIFGNLSDRRILLLGAGEIGAKAARAFRSRGARLLTVASRRPEAADSLARELGAATLAFESREARLAEFDVIVSCTSAAGTVLSAPGVTAAMRSRPDRPLFFIDLALPRDIDPGVGRLANVFVYNLDDLAKIAEENRAARSAEVARCHALIEARADALWGHLAFRVFAA
ncbi:MAG: glutamyl-tRNA reductase [Opitutaceae bacterium]